MHPKETESILWDKSSVDLIATHKTRRKGLNILQLNAVTMIDPAMGWVKI